LIFSPSAIFGAKGIRAKEKAGGTFRKNEVLFPNSQPFERKARLGRSISQKR
jgi:hypothetical protein